jgi:hypothetical protein
MSEQRDRIALSISGDLHAIGAGKIHRSGSIDLSRNPLNVILSGPVGTADRGFPSSARGIGSTPSAHLDLEETYRPVEDHGFTLVDFERDRIVMRLFSWDVDREPVEAIDRLEPVFTTALEPPA